MAKILIADDEELIRKLISDCLAKEGHTVITADNGEEAYELFEENEDVGLCILDIMMPGIDGWELCRKIRETSGVPIMLVSARSQDFDQILGFENGADDYVTKPFSLAVLSRRANALIQRGGTHEPTGVPDPAVKEFGGIKINTNSFEVFLNGEKLELTAREYAILKLFCESSGRVMSRNYILDAVWGSDYVGDERTVDSHIVRLRAKIADWKEHKIITIYGSGYKLS